MPGHRDSRWKSLVDRIWQVRKRVSVKATPFRQQSAQVFKDYSSAANLQNSLPRFFSMLGCNWTFFCRTQSMMLFNESDPRVESLQIKEFPQYFCTRSRIIKRAALNLLGSGGHGFAGATGHVRRAPCAAGTEKDWNVNLWRFQHHDSPLVLPWFISQVMPNPSVLPNWFAFTNRRKIIGSTEYVYSSIFMYIPCWYHLLMFFFLSFCSDLLLFHVSRSFSCYPRRLQASCWMEELPKNIRIDAVFVKFAVSGGGGDFARRLSRVCNWGSKWFECLTVEQCWVFFWPTCSVTIPIACFGSSIVSKISMFLGNPLLDLSNVIN